MPIYLVPAMLQIEAADEHEANMKASDVCMVNNTREAALFLDEELPTIECSSEFPHTMLDEAVCGAIFGRG